MLRKTLFIQIILAVTLVSSLNSAYAHDIPSRVTVFAFVKPDETQLTVLMRVPMEAFSEIAFPLVGPGYLKISEAESSLRDAAQVYITESIHLYENGVELRNKELGAVRVNLPSNRSFTSFEAAHANLRSSPLSDDENLIWRQGLLDLEVSYLINSERSEFSIDPQLGRLSDETTTVLRYVLPNGAERVFNYIGNPGVVQLDPSWYQASMRFVAMGFSHILEGIDHLLFLFCLIIPIVSLRRLIPIITSFTVGHSITLLCSAFGFTPGALWFPVFIESLIALSIVYMAIENIVAKNLDHRWVAAFGFGLVHGFGFSFLFRDTLQFAGGHLFTSLLAFNIGVELGQLLVLVIMIPLLMLLFQHIVNKRLGIIILSAVIAHTAWHWMLDRGSQLNAYDYSLPVFDTQFFASSMRFSMMLIIIAFAWWGLFELFKRFSKNEQERSQ